MKRRGRAFGAMITAVLGCVSLSASQADEFQSRWHHSADRTWVGADYWANRLGDWRIRGGRLECIEAGPRRPMRTVHLLTQRVRAQRGTLRMRVRTSAIAATDAKSAGTWTGFLIGAGGEHVDYRISAHVHHRPAEDGGLLAVLDGTGQIIFRDNSKGIGRGPTGPLGADELTVIPPTSRKGGDAADRFPAEAQLQLVAEPSGDRYRVTVTARNPESGELISQATLEDVEPGLIEGSIALVSHLGPPGSQSGYWYRDWQVSGSKVVRHGARAFGPILCTQYTLSGGVLKMTAQMPPLGKEDNQTAELQIPKAGSTDWQTVAEARLVPDSFTFPFRVDDWDATQAARYRVVYRLRTGPGASQLHSWEGTVREEPRGESPFVVAGFTGHKCYTNAPLRWNRSAIWFPHNELTGAVAFHNPDLLFFSGDQIYEGDLTGVVRAPPVRANLDYLYKWYRWCWAFRDLTRDRPSICIPDDHDVYHGNVWGAGGRAAKTPDDGGYTMSPEFVNMIQRTQTSHLPDPVDPEPVEQGIGVYFTHMNYGGISFAILEDRKWKSSPTVAVPEGKIVNGWSQNPAFDPATEADVPGAVLLGKRQLRFLRAWAADWNGGTWMKVVLSQTIFANVATLPEDATGDGVIPKLKPVPAGVIPKDYKLAADADSNSWPQSGRNRALRELRRGFAFHLAGDQHLGSFVHYGVDDWDDAGFAFCVPSIGNTFPRRWYPPMPGGNRKPGTPAYTGQFKDGFGNYVTVYAVSNPVLSGREPAALYDRAPGYGIVRFDPKTRDITVECWPRWIDPSEPNAAQYAGWPVTIHQLANYSRRAGGFLPTIEVEGLSDPVVQVVDESDGEVVYTLRIKGTRFQAKVFRQGTYTVKVMEPDTNRIKTLEAIQSREHDSKQILRVSF